MLVRQVDKTHQTAKFVRNPNSSICLETLFSRRYLKALPEHLPCKLESTSFRPLNRTPFRFE